MAQMIVIIQGPELEDLVAAFTKAFMGSPKAWRDMAYVLESEVDDHTWQSFVSSAHRGSPADTSFHKLLDSELKALPEAIQMALLMLQHKEE